MVARLRRGLTKRDLASQTGLTERTLFNYECGAAAPPPGAVGLLARALRFPETFFYRGDLELTSARDGASFRALSRTSARLRDRALAGGALAFELSAWIDRRFQLPIPDLPDLRPERDPEAAAMALRSLWSLGDSPISNMVHLLESRGVRVFSLAEDGDEIDAFSLWRGDYPFVFLNTMKSGERSRFDAAHELGHLVLHRHGPPSGQRAESEANRFASAFLLPRTGLLHAIPAFPTLNYLVQAKLPWGVSVAALAHRLHDLSCLSESYYRALSIEIQKHSYRRREPLPSPREQSQVLGKVFDTLRSEGLRRNDVATQLCWPAEELNSIVFQLVLSSIAGEANSAAPAPTKPSLFPKLQLHG